MTINSFTFFWSRWADKHDSSFPLNRFNIISWVYHFTCMMWPGYRLSLRWRKRKLNVLQNLNLHIYVTVYYPMNALKMHTTYIIKQNIVCVCGWDSFFSGVLFICRSSWTIDKYSAMSWQLNYWSFNLWRW
jgi:hypothetical protein